MKTKNNKFFFEVNINSPSIKANYVFSGHRLDNIIKYLTKEYNSEMAKQRLVKAIYPKGIGVSEKSKNL